MRDRREVLKLLAGGTAVAAGASLITTSSAFADGGTPGFLPSCPNATSTPSTSIVATWDANVTGQANKKLWVNVSVGTATCSSGWTASYQVNVTATTSSIGVSLELRNNASNALLNNATPASSGFVTVAAATNLTFRVTSLSDGVLDNGTNVALTIVVRRVCTNNTNANRKAYCCRSYTLSAAFVRANPDLWGTPSTASGNFGAGTAPLNTADCPKP